MGRKVLLTAGVVVLLMGGSAVAASRWIITNVNQIKPSVRAQLKGNRGPRGFKGAQGPQGVQGGAGPQGPQGPAGPTVLGKLVRIAGPDTSVAPGADGASTAFCPSGYDIVSGGYQSISASSPTFFSDSFGGNDWAAGLDNFNSSISGDVQAFAFCAPAGQAVAASARYASRATVLRRVQAAETRVRQLHTH